MTADAPLPPILPSDDDEPAFDEPWQARAVALVAGLHQRGVFTWREWTDALTAQLHAGESSTASYEHRLRALERLLAAKGVVPPAELTHRAEQWRQAYRATPHGDRGTATR